MERSDSLIKFVSIAVLTALVIYIAISFYRSKTDPFQTVEASAFELSESMESQGFAVRQEDVISASGNVAVIISDGQKVSAGQAIAFRYNGAQAMERAQEMNDIRMRISQLNAAMAGKTGQELAADSVLELSRAVSSGDLSGLYSLALNMDTYIISGQEIAQEDQESEIEALQAQLQGLVAESAADTERIDADVEGTFTSAVDGFESVSPDMLEDISPDGLREIFASPDMMEMDSIGKLITGIRWYYAAIVEEDAAVWLSPGDTVRLDFTRTYSASLNMTVESVGESRNGECVIVFSCDRFLQDVASLREMTATIVFESLSGIRVPKEAVHLDEDGDTLVYILEGLQASAEYVDIIAESGDYYMVAESGDGLRVGDQIITRASNLYDGAVVQ